MSSVQACDINSEATYHQNSKVVTDDWIDLEVTESNETHTSSNPLLELEAIVEKQQEQEQNDTSLFSFLNTNANQYLCIPEKHGGITGSSGCTGPCSSNVETPVPTVLETSPEYKENSEEIMNKTQTVNDESGTFCESESNTETSENNDITFTKTTLKSSENVTENMTPEFIATTTTTNEHKQKHGAKSKPMCRICYPPREQRCRACLINSQKRKRRTHYICCFSFRPLMLKTSIENGILSIRDRVKQIKLPVWRKTNNNTLSPVRNVQHYPASSSSASLQSESLSTTILFALTSWMD